MMWIVIITANTMMFASPAPEAVQRDRVQCIEFARVLQERNSFDAVMCMREEDVPHDAVRIGG